MAGDDPDDLSGLPRGLGAIRRGPREGPRLPGRGGLSRGQGLEAFPEALRITYIAEKESALGPTATVLQTALRDVGIPMELDPIPQTQYGERELVKKDMPLGSPTT